MRLKIFLVFGIIVIAVVFGLVYFLTLSNKPQEESRTELTPIATPISKMKLTSSAFLDNQPIPKKYTCDGENMSPPLTIAQVPEGAQSLVLIMDDPDAPSRTFVHWTVWNIDAKTTEIPEGTAPQGAMQGFTDFGSRKYGGPCPPSGTHRYIFKLYALDSRLLLSENSRKEDLEREMADHVLDFTQFIGLYSRER